jgi:cytochrome d ubiquinol oxidase subunit II
METLWFMIVAGMVAAYVVLDGFDLGVGFVHGFLARTPGERRAVMESIGPFWDGNEVWLLAAGGVLYFAFPKLYASSFSGFYLPLMIVLWLLMLRGIAIEFGGHLENPLWRVFWDRVFAGASMLLTVFFGAALGNVVRGVPLDGRGEFFLPLWTDFSARGELGVLDWYTVLVGVLAAATLAMHGALWVNLKVSGAVRERSARFARRALAVVAALVAAVTAATFAIQPLVPASFAARPWTVVFPALAVAGLALVFLRAGRPGGELAAFLGSVLFIVGMLTSAASGVYPYVLPGHPGQEFGLTVENTKTSEYGMRVAILWWVPALALAVAYFAFLYRRFGGKVEVQEG